MITWLDSADAALPDTRLALPRGSDAPGLLAAGGELTPQRLQEAYSKGVFPWYSDGQPVLWWSPDPRMVLMTDEFRLSRSLRKTVLKFARTPDCEVRIDSDFRAVITACSQVPRPGQDGTWIVGEIIDAYSAWHRLGRAHSVETWVNGELAGGLYCIAIGRMVYGESMFARRTDASKIAVAALVAFCRHHGVAMIDCQQRTGHLASLGGREIPRAEFERRLTQAAAKPDISDWSYDSRMWSRLATPGPTPEDAGP